MLFNEIVKNRYSVRRFKDIEVEEQRIIEIFTNKLLTNQERTKI